MSIKSNALKRRRGIHDPDRKGILIPAQQLENSGFSPDDRFSVSRIQRELFALTIVESAQGDIHFDKYGIFIRRTRHVDAQLGGIYTEFSVELDPAHRRLTLRPLDHGISSLAVEPGPD